MKLDFKKIIFLLTSLALINAKIGKGMGLDGGAIHQDDIVEFDLRHVFDLSQMDYKKSQFIVSDPAKYYSFDTPYVTDSLVQEYTSHEWSKVIGDSSVIMIFNNKTIRYQQVDRRGAVLGSNWTFDVTTIGPRLECQDAILYEPKGFIFVVCTSSGSQTSKPSINIFSLNIKDGSVAGKYVATQDQYIIRNQASLLLHEFTADKTMLVLYDKGMSHTAQTRENYFIVTFIGVDVGVPVLNEVQQFAPPADSEWVAFYDVNLYQNSLIISGRLNTTSAFISYTLCQYDKSETTLQCGASVASKVGEGYVRIINDELLVEYDVSATTATFFALAGNFGADAWKTLSSTHAVEYQGDDHSWIKDYQGTEDQGCFMYSQTGNTDKGVVLHSTVVNDIESSWFFLGQSGAVFENSYMLADTNTIYLYRLSGPFVLVKGSDFTESNATLSITAKDDSTTGITETAEIRIVSKPSKIPPKVDWTAPYIDAFYGSIMEIPFDGGDVISGNGIKYDVQFDSKTIQPFVISSYGVNYNFNYPIATDMWTTVSLGHNWFVGQTKSKMINFNSCQFKDIRMMSCVSSNKKTYTNYTLYTRSTKHFDVIVAYGRDQKEGKSAFFISSDSQGLTQQEFDGIFVDVDGTSDKDGNIYSAVAMESAVNFFEIYANNPTKAVQTSSLDCSENGPFGKLCPTQIHFNPRVSGLIHILSQCENDNTRIINYRFNSPHIGHDVIELDTIAGSFEFCPTGEEIIMFNNKVTPEVLYTIDAFNSLSRFSIDIQDYGVDNMLNFYCLKHIQQFAILSADPSTQMRTLAVFYGNRRMNADRRMNVRIDSLQPQDTVLVEGFALEHGSMFATFSGEGHLSFTGALNDPPLISGRVFSSDFDHDYPVNMDINLSAFTFKTNVHVPVTIRIPKEDVSFKFISTKSAPKVGIVNIEEYSEIRGPITGVEFVGKHDNVEILPRVRDEQSLIPDTGVAALTYDIFRGTPQLGVGLSRDDSQLHTLGIFQNGKVAHTVSYPYLKTFDFGTFNSGKNILVISSLTNGFSGRNCVIEAAVSDFKVLAFKQLTTITGDISKIRIAPGLRDGEFLIAASNGFQIGFLVAKVDLTKKAITITETGIQSIDMGLDFDLTFIEKTFDVYYTQIESTGYGRIDIDRDNFGMTSSIKNKIPKSDMPAYLTAIACAASSENTMLVVINSVGTRLFQISDSLNGHSSVKTLDKYGDYEGMQLYITNSYTALYATRLSMRSDSAVLIYMNKVLSEGDDPTIHAIIPVNTAGAKFAGSPSPLQHLRYRKNRATGVSATQFQQEPFTMSEDPTTHETIIMLGTPSGKTPAYVTSIHPFELNIKVPTDLKTLVLKFSGSSGSFFADIDSLIEGDVTPSGSSSTTSTSESPSTRGDLPIWPFLVILALLVLAAVAWFVYVHLKEKNEEDGERDSDMAKTDPNYISMQPTDTKFSANMTDVNLDDDLGETLN